MNATVTIVDQKNQSHTYSSQEIMSIADKLRNQPLKTITVCLTIGEDINFWQLKKFVGIVEASLVKEEKLYTKSV